ncbi:hypothetical protein F5Y13DRAFT_172170 [Hypoxylon sp. FL1857]|nr:hypothetical protein F5Y13DRAFT_172170 [Hypoxylon sp. FL1857]
MRPDYLKISRCNATFISEKVLKLHTNGYLPRYLVMTPGMRGDGNGTIQDLSVLGLLGCAELWMLKVRNPIMRLLEYILSDYPQAIGRLDPLAQEAYVPDNGGLSQGILDF